jgi:hypothetical protein
VQNEWKKSAKLVPKPAQCVIFGMTGAASIKEMLN